ncbi:MAG: hypothetical protein N2749_03485 [Clostridia bacterium]|nr:hypothetical protein [Clostridia bacterium]
MKTNKDELIAFNSYGGFDTTNNEYHILNTNTPLPWCNIIANEHFGSIISNKGTVYTYYKNSREFKLTNWCNDWVTFEPGERFKGIFEYDYNIIYGFGYVKVIEENEFISKSMDIFIPNNSDVKIHYITLKNKTEVEQNHKIEYILEPTMGVSKEISGMYIICKEINDSMCFKNPYNLEFSDNTAFVTVVSENNFVMTEYDSSNFTTKVDISIPKNGSISFAIILGVSEKNGIQINDILAQYDNMIKIQDSHKNTKKYWSDLVVKNFSTGDKYIDILANGWLLYQTIVCRLYARSAFYQSGGAIGFRDQLQDSLALISSWPEKTKNQIILHSSKQFEKGDVLHWWHEHNNAGIRTYFSDDYLWLPYVTTEYIKLTNDLSILDIKAKYLEDKPMGNKRELYEVFYNIETEASIYEHCKKAILYGLSRISEDNGLLDIGDGDWNDGFSNIRGQSVWLTFFMMDILDRFSSLASHKEDKEMTDICKKYIHKFKHSIIAYAWDNGHFVRAFYENGEVLGASSNEECKIDLISQAWAAIALKKFPDLEHEINQSLDAAEKYLVDKNNMIVSLLYPAFDKPKNNPGYIKAYVPGTRENGGQYTHAAIWLAKAYFEVGKYDKGIEILKYLNPIYHSDNKQKADIYMVEPYVLAADVYTNPDHIGRGGWTWYTGSSAWMYKTIEDFMK